MMLYLNPCTDFASFSMADKRERATERRRKQRAAEKGLMNLNPLQCTFIRANGIECCKMIQSDAVIK